MARLYVMLLVIAICARVDAARRKRLPPREFENCPERCECLDFNCELDEGEVYCADLEVVCKNANVSSNLELLPKNATRLSITGENMGHTTLDIFARFDDLLKLSLVNNTIRSLKLSKAIGFIDYLNLDDNNLCFLPRRKLVLLNSLETLKLQQNNLTFIHEIKFPPSLVRLDMSHNHIESPRKGSFRRLRNLEFLELDNNSITAIIPRAFRHLISLQSLNLDYNQISHLPQNAFTAFPSISFISLKHNLIETINPTAFKQAGIRWHGQHEIRLDHNRLRILEAHSFEIFKYPRIRDYYGIHLFGNPLFCDCEMTIIRDTFGRLFRDFYKTPCHTPADLERIPVGSLHISGCTRDVAEE